MNIVKLHHKNNITMGTLAFVISMLVSLFFNFGITGVGHADERPIVTAATDAGKQFKHIRHTFEVKKRIFV